MTHQGRTPTYSEERIVHVMGKITKRGDKRLKKIISDSPLFSNSAIYVDWTTSLEKKIMHFCRQYLMLHYPRRPQDARVRLRKVREYAKLHGVTRRVARESLRA